MVEVTWLSEVTDPGIVGVVQGVEGGELSALVVGEGDGTAGSVVVGAGGVETWAVVVVSFCGGVGAGGVGAGGVGAAVCWGIGVVVEVEDLGGSSSESTSITTTDLFFDR